MLAGHSLIHEKLENEVQIMYSNQIMRGIGSKC